jgi:hypothetical protein
MFFMKDENMNERLALAIYALVENSYEFTDEGFSYAEACDVLNLSADEKSAVLALIDDDLRIV